jgi:hypothetical protein
VVLKGWAKFFPRHYERFEAAEEPVGAVGGHGLCLA